MNTLKLTKSKIDPRWGADNRKKKAFSIFQTVSESVDFPIHQTQWLDIGCGSGGIANYISKKVKSMTGIDPESWERWDTFQRENNNLTFIKESVESLSCKDNTFDVVICNQVYEHVPDPVHLINEIYRILKPGGICYFAGPNLLFPIEPHVFWPFVHWLPRQVAIKIMTFMGSKNTSNLDAYSVSYWKLMKWFKKYEVKNALPIILKNPQKYGKSKLITKVLSLLPIVVLEKLTFISPGFIFILKKNQ